MNIDLSLAPANATHYMTQEGNNYSYYFLEEGGDWITVVDAKKEAVRETVYDRSSYVKAYFNGKWRCTCFPINFSLENE